MATADMKITIDGLQEFIDGVTALRKGLDEVAATVHYGTTVGRLANRYRLNQSLDVIAEEYGQLPRSFQDALIKFCQDFPAIVDRAA